jgi:predicted nucleotidyltransferase
MGRMTIDDQVREQIVLELRRIEDEKNVRILYACESGSRAWGFASADSDYDVRFLYLHPVEWYLGIGKKRDVIEWEVGNLDISGWELRKALGLLRKSNPPLLEWLQSAIVYWSMPKLVIRLRGMMQDCYSPVAGFYHYFHMAKGNYRQYLEGETVWLKKYLYVLRPILACLWIERGYGTKRGYEAGQRDGLVPVKFDTLVRTLVPEGPLREAIGDLVRKKQAGAELDRGPRIPAISDFLDRELERLSDWHAIPGRVLVETEDLNQFFRYALIHQYGNIFQLEKNVKKVRRTRRV